MKSSRRLMKFAAPYTWYFVVTSVSMLIYTVLNGISVFSVVPLVDRIITGKNISLTLSLNIPYRGKIEELIGFLNALDKKSLLMWIGVFVCITFLLKGIVSYLEQVAMEIGGQRVARDIRSKIYNKYYRLPMTYFSRSRLGELISRITNDVNLILEVFSGRFITNIKDSVQFLPFFIAIIIIDWKLSLLTMVALPLLVAPIAMLGRKIRKITRKTQEKVADISSVIHETVSGIRIVKIFCMENYEQDRFYRELDKFQNIRVDFVRKEALLNPFTEIIGGITVLFVLIVFSPKVLKGEITPGFFMTYLVCLASMIKPIRTIGKLNFALQNAFSALDRIFGLLDAPEGIVDAAGARDFSEIKKDLVFSGVSFAYDKESLVLKDIDFSAGVNRITAIVGPSGCGKTTLVNLIPRFFDPHSGTIRIDGTDIREYRLLSLREKIAMVTQETFLFNDTVARNISYGHEEISREKIKEIARLAHAHEFIEGLPNGYDTIIGEKGARLSGGEKQRLAIARALLKNPPILILDEATSALDTESERIVQDAINILMRERTVIVIAHRLSTIMRADVIYVIDGGRVVEKGRHDELLKNNALYKKLYEMQFV
jgi:ATP-binding cassette, subfamily B, bacterial MsbA